MKQLKRISSLITEASKKNEQDRVQAEAQRFEAIKEIGNLVHASVPVSNNEV